MVKQNSNSAYWHEHVDSIDLGLLGTEIDFEQFEKDEDDE